METEVKKIPYLDLKAINEPYEKEIKDAINKVVNSGWYLQGEAVKKFEKSYAQFIGTEYCISCANGTDALKLMLMGELAIGNLQKGDEVIVPANTYFATVLAISSVGLTPVLVDANIDTLQIDDQLIEARITPKTRAIMIVHLYGKLAWTPKIAEICKKHHLLLFEDNAQGFGCSTTLSDSSEKPSKRRYTGNLSDAAAHSFYPSKNLGALGDAGAVTTNNRELAEAIMSLHEYGKIEDGIFRYQGVNSRMDEIQAAVLNVKLQYPENEQKARHRQIQLYLEHLDDSIKDRCIAAKLISPAHENVFHVFPFLTPKRDQLKAFLAENGVGTKIHYFRPPYLQPCYPEMNHLEFPVAKRIADEELSLPCNSSLNDEDIIRVSKLINQFLA